MTFEAGWPSMRRKLRDWSSAGMPRRRRNMSTRSNIAVRKRLQCVSRSAAELRGKRWERQTCRGVCSGNGQPTFQTGVHDHEERQMQTQQTLDHAEFWSDIYRGRSIAVFNHHGRWLVYLDHVLQRSAFATSEHAIV